MRALLKWVVRVVLKPAFSPKLPIEAQRKRLQWIVRTNLMPFGITVDKLDMNGVPAESLSTRCSGSTAAILFLHGGGYCVGSPGSHRALAARLARACCAEAFVPDYRLAPEHPHPAAIEDALAAYKWLLAQGYPPDRIAIVGDSAGGGLTLLTAIALRDAGARLPAVLGLISPWTDVSNSGESFTTRAARDPMLSPEIGGNWSALFRAGLDAKSPACSPLYAELRGLPPMLIQVGSEEILLDDSRRFAEKARVAGCEVRLHEYEGLWHVFQLHGGMLADADEAIAELAGFLREHWTPQVAQTKRRVAHSAA